MEPILSQILAYFAERQKVLEPGVDPASFDYFAAGWVDSLSLLDFVSDMEIRLATKLSDEDLGDSDFVTLGGAARLFAKSKNQS